MAVAALIVSIVAILAAGASAEYSRRMARDTAQLRRNDDARRHLERAPEFRGDVESMNSGRWHRLRLELTTPEPLTGLTAELIGAVGVAFPSNQNGVPPGGASSRADWNEPLSAGERAVWVITLPNGGPALTLKVRATCRRWDGEWTVLVEVPVRSRVPRVGYSTDGGQVQ